MMMVRLGDKIRSFPLELIFWITALFALAMTDPSTPHYSLCLFRFLGWKHCPGCGLGHSIAYLIRGNFSASWHSHFFGIPALCIILHRIAVLGSPYYLKIKTFFNGPQLPIFPPRNRQPGNTIPARFNVGNE